MRLLRPFSAPHTVYRGEAFSLQPPPSLSLSSVPPAKPALLAPSFVSMSKQATCFSFSALLLLSNLQESLQKGKKMCVGVWEGNVGVGAEPIMSPKL